jgi:invasion protein IalB
MDLVPASPYSSSLAKTDKAMRSLVLTLLCILPLIAAGTPSHAQTRTEKTFDDWLVTCQEQGEKKACGLSQTFRDAKTKRIALSWIITRDVNGSDKAVVRTPTAVALADGLRVAVPTAGEFVAAYRFCGPRACTAEFAFTDEWLKAFRGQGEFSATFKPVGGNPVTLKGSLKGFSAAYDFFAEQS